MYSVSLVEDTKKDFILIAKKQREIIIRKEYPKQQTIRDNALCAAQEGRTETAPFSLFAPFVCEKLFMKF